jgi:hypothetical protein
MGLGLCWYFPELLHHPEASGWQLISLAAMVDYTVSLVPGTQLALLGKEWWGLPSFCCVSWPGTLRRLEGGRVISGTWLATDHIPDTVGTGWVDGATIWISNPLIWGLLSKQLNKSQFLSLRPRASYWISFPQPQFLIRKKERRAREKNRHLERLFEDSKMKCLDAWTPDYLFPLQSLVPGHSSRKSPSASS